MTGCGYVTYDVRYFVNNGFGVPTVMTKKEQFVIVNDTWSNTRQYSYFPEDEIGTSLFSRWDFGNIKVKKKQSAGVLSMKKVILLVVVIVLGVSGLFAFRLFTDSLHNVELNSKDGKVKLVFEKATTEEISRISTGTYEFLLVDDKNLYTDFILTNPSYLYSLDENNTICEGETDRYVFCIDKHYFYVESVDDGYKSNAVRYKELISSFYLENGDAVMLVSPLREADDLEYGSTNYFNWEDTVGINSFEDLVSFYSCIDANLYTVDKDNQSIYVYDLDDIIFSGDDYPKSNMTTKIHATQKGLEFSLVNNEDILK